MQILKIYEKYKIIPALQEHMFRVSSVAMMIAKHMTIDVDIDYITKAALLHDMGNILKFNLSFFPEFLKPEGLEYWKLIQNEYKEKYGNDEHMATFKIISEIGVSSHINELVHAYGFAQSITILADHDYSKKISLYSDHRVGPYGIRSLIEKINNGRIRYKENKNKDITKS